MVTNKCQYCGKEFQSGRVGKKYCSYVCENHGRWTDRICLNCGKTFRPSGKNTKCCSISCSKIYQLRDVKRKKTTVKCFCCGKVFTKRNVDIAKTDARNGRHYCSRECMGEGYKDRITLTCSQCGIEFQRARSGVDTEGKYYFCSKVCQAKNFNYHLSGSDHWHYINGETSYKRGENWHDVKKLVRKRDNYTCQICGKKGNGKHLDVHHITPYRMFDDYLLANDLDNLITLCASCHHKEDANLIKREKES